MHARNRTWMLGGDPAERCRQRLLPVEGGISPSLALDFSSGTLDPRITFTRSTFGTYYRGAFNQNLVTQSETFSGWYTDGATPATSGESNPQNSGNAYGITESATTGNHRFGFTAISARQPSSQVTVSAYVKAGLRTLFAIQNNALANSTMTFQLTGSGSYGTLQSNVISASITPVGNGWYRCSVTLLTATNGGVTPMIYALTGTLGSGVSSYAGDNTAPALYVWGVQATEGSLLTPYIPTTTAAITQGQIAASQPWNLLLQSAAVRSASWTTGGLTTAGASITAPDGTANGVEIVGSNGTVTGGAFVYQGVVASEAVAYTASIFLKAKGTALNTTIRMQSRTGVAAISNLSVTFNNTTGAVGTVASGTWTSTSATSTPVGNDWYRVTLTGTTSATTTLVRLLVFFDDTSNGTDGVYAWGAQINEGATALDYNPTTTQANYLPRFEYNPVSGAFRGLLIEGASTNLLQQSAAVRTSPWVTAQFTTAGASITAPDGTVSGVECVAVNGAGSATAYSYQQITATASTAYTTSFFLKAKGTALNTIVRMQARASTTVLSNLDVTFNNATGTVGSVTSGTWTATSATSTPIGNGWYRVTLTGTTPATTNNLWAAFFFDATGNGTDGVYAWGAQVEAQSFASSYIPTVSGTVARAADSAVMTGTNFSSWYNETEGTLLCFHAGRPTSSSGRGAEINNNTSDERHALSSGGTAQYVCTDNGSTQASIGFTIPDADQKRYAAAYRVNDFGLSVNGNTTLTDLTGNLPTVDRLWIGSSSASANFLQSTISRISYWPTRLPNDQLVSLTTIPSTALAITAIQAGAKIDLTWTQVPGVEGATYEVERSTDGGATWSPLTTSFGLAFNDTTALFPGTYTYRVRANVGGDVTDWSSQVSETTVDVPSAPGSLTVTGATTSSISLSWTDSTGEDFYGIEVSPDGLGSWSLAGTASANATTFTHTPLAESVQRYYRVNGINKAGGGVYSSTVNSWTVPLAPTSLTATAVSSSQIDLAWTDVSTGNQSYKVERSTDNVNWTEIATGLAANATSYSAVGLTGSTLYYFRVRAANAARDSAYSNTASATTQAGGLTPAWSLDFSTGTPSGYTLTRASSATRVDSSGYVASASTDIARLTHDSSGSRLGLLVEESRTNSLQRSEEFDNAYWTKGGLLAFGSGSTANAATAPDNTTTADLITENSGGTVGHYVVRTFGTMAIGTSYTFSCFVKKPTSNARNFATIGFSGASGHRLVRTFDLNDGTSTRNNFAGTNFSTESGGSEDYGNGWWRLWIQITIGATAVTFVDCVVATSTTETPALQAGVYPNHSGDGVSGLLIWGAQLEANATMSSYIPTTTASVTRSADLVHVLDSAITSWGDPGALVVHFYPPGQAGTLISTDDASTAQVGIEASTATDVRAFWSSGSTAAETMTTGVQKAVHYWNGSTPKLCLNGGPVRSGTNNFTIANADFVTLGAEATDSAGAPGTFSQYANCIIRKVEFYSGTLSDANLQTITS